MSTISKILAPVVFSERCGYAARYAARLAKLFGAELVFLHVGEECMVPILDAFLQAETGSNDYESLVVCGDPADHIVEIARGRQIDLIVMPTYARGAFQRLLLGSVTAKVLQDADCPVLTGVHHGGDPVALPDIIRNIVCAVDVGGSCVPLIRWATTLANGLNGNLKLIHAIPAADETSDNLGVIKVRRYLFREASEAFARNLAENDLNVTVDLAGGDVTEVVRETALEEHADLVVIGRGHSGSRLGTLRTHTYDIIRRSPCPVVSV